MSAGAGVLERVHLSIAPGTEEEFEAAMTSNGLGVLRAAAGCRSAELRRGVERPGTYLLLVEWDAVEAHTAFTQDPAFGGLVEILKAHLAGPTDMEHFGAPVGAA